MRGFGVLQCGRPGVDMALGTNLRISGEDLDAGSIVVLGERTVRIRRLPLA
jgi:hypothetical protein